MTVSTMDVVDERMPVYTYRVEDGRDRWTVARGALGNEGARWLPVRRRRPMRARRSGRSARSHGLLLEDVARVSTPPVGEVLARHRSAPLVEILKGMLRYSTNITAEVAGLHAGAASAEMPATLHGSAA